MPRWLLLIVSLFVLTLVVPVWVLLMTAGNWRTALSAWRFFAVKLLLLALPAALIALFML